MARLPRLVVPQYPHHVTQRGARRQTTFFSQADYAAYVSLLAAAKAEAGVEIWAYCLMPNHVHLVVVPDRSNSLTLLFSAAHLRYTRRINIRHGWSWPFVAGAVPFLCYGRATPARRGSLCRTEPGSLRPLQQSRVLAMVKRSRTPSRARRPPRSSCADVGTRGRLAQVSRYAGHGRRAGRSSRTRPNGATRRR